jgi:hypothetical protein
MHFYSNTHPPLFNKHDLRERLEQDFNAAVKAADELPRERLMTKTNEQLAQEIIAANVLVPLEVDATSYEAEEREVAIDERQGGGTTIVYDIHIPFRGRPGLVHCQPSRSPGKFVHGEATESTIVLSYLQRRSELLQRAIANDAKLVKEWVDAVNADIAAMTRQAEQEVIARLARRQLRFGESRALLAALDIPIKKVPSGESLEVPLARRRVTPELNEPTGVDHAEWRLSHTTYEQIVATVTRFSHALERRPSSARILLPDEETLRDWLIFILNSTYETDSDGDVFITGEALNGHGKTDILVHQHGRNVFIGECKFWKGPQSFQAAINQLLGYLVWRDTKAAIVLFITQKNAGAIIDKADRCLQQHRKFAAAVQADEPNRRRDYVLTSPHDAGRKISLALIPVVIGVSSSPPRTRGRARSH